MSTPSRQYPDHMTFECENCGQRVYVGPGPGPSKYDTFSSLSSDGACPECGWREGEPVRWSCPFPVGARVRWTPAPPPINTGTVITQFVGGRCVGVQLDGARVEPYSPGREINVDELTLVDDPPRDVLRQQIEDETAAKIAKMLRGWATFDSMRASIAYESAANAIESGEWRK